MKLIPYIAIVAVIALGGYFFSNRSSVPDSQVSGADNSAQDNQVLKFSATIENRSYNPKQIDVPFGATVELTIKNNDNEQHGLGIAVFGVQGFVGPKQTKTVRFVADKRGEANTFCSTAHPEKLIINVN